MRVFDNPDLYPTPLNVIEQMTAGLDLYGKTVLEPSAGLGDIVDFCAGSGAAVLACEIVPELREALNGKACNVIGEDFLELKAEQVSHIDFIIMNPPFSQGAKHIVHAWNIAPDGCEIRALCNAQTILNPRLNGKVLVQYIRDYGCFENLGNCFSDAERQTDVEVGFITLRKPAGKHESEFDGFFMEDEEEQQFNGMQQYNFVRDVVNRYVGAVKIFDVQLEAAKQMNALTDGFSRTKIALKLTEKEAVKTREEYKKELQKDAWRWVINKFELNKYATSGLNADINKFVETQSEIPFTMKNIYQMITIIIGTTGNRMDKALEEVFDKLTAHYHDNRYAVEGWKTNSHYLVNEKFILPDIFGDPYSTSAGLKIAYGRRNYDLFDDFMKALCYITGKDYNRVPTLYNLLQNDYVVYKDGEVVMEKSPHGDHYSVAGFRKHGYSNEEGIKKTYPETEGYYYVPRPRHGEWFDFEFFQVKGFKKGTGHFKFKDRDVWATFNQHIARIKGFPLPEAIKKHTK